MQSFYKALEELKSRTAYREENEPPLRVYQILPSVCRGDTISNDALEIYKVLSDQLIRTHIYAAYIGSGISSRRVSPIEEMPHLSPEDIIIYHMSTESGMYAHIRRIKRDYGCTIIFRYHSITPPEYFEAYDQDIAKQCRMGLREAERIRDIPTEVLAVSVHDRKQLRRLGYTCPIMILPPLVPLSEYTIEPEEGIMERYREDTCSNLLYVGQIVPHKRIERIMDIYDRCRKGNDQPLRLFLVGSIMEVEEYYRYLEDYRIRLGYREDEIVITGHVAFNEMIAYYRLADVFLCMSEAEGFGMSLVEAMFYQVPVLAYEAGAVPETLGGSGILLPIWQPSEVAGVVHTVLQNQNTRNQILEGQNRRLESLIEESPRRELIRVIESMRR